MASSKKKTTAKPAPKFKDLKAKKDPKGGPAFDSFLTITSKGPKHP
jgi:hypothetical protein